jgi:hypothetical protein
LSGTAGQEILSTIAFFAAVLLYPTLTGPVAALVLVLVLKRQERWPRLFFWPALIALHIAGFFFLEHTLGDFVFGPGFLSCLITPIFAVSTALGLRLSSGRFYRAVGDDPGRRRWLIAGTVLIPLLQLGTVLTLILLAPSR